MTDKQVMYAKELQKNLRSLNPIKGVHQALCTLNIDNDTSPRFIDNLLEAIKFEEYMDDFMFGGDFMQD